MHFDWKFDIISIRTMFSWRKRIIGLSGGFTLVEVSITLAIIGFITVIVVSGATTNIRTQRFSDQVRAFANVFTSAQTTSYANQINAQGSVCPNPIAINSSINAFTPSAVAVGPKVCFWRGNVLDIDTTTPTSAIYIMSLLYGDDISQASANLSQQDGILGQLPPMQVHNSNGLSISTQFDIANPNCGDSNIPSWTSTNQISVAFLAPDGNAWTSQGLPAGFGDYTRVDPFPDHYPIRFNIRDSGAPNLSGLVTVIPCSGSITTQVN